MSEGSTTTPRVLWEPPAELTEQATMARFMRAHGHADYDALWRWSVEDLEGFWAAIWDFFGVAGEHGPVLGDDTMPGAEWFPGTEISYAEHLFSGKPDDRVAIIGAGELAPEPVEWTWRDLRARTARIAAGLRELGVERGDRVVAYMPNLPETMAAFLAVASLGAVWSSCSPDFGLRSVVDRFAQIEPKVLLAVDGYRYGGRDFDRRDVVAALREQLPTVEHTLLLPHPAPARSRARSRGRRPSATAS
jgi:acetoacetyl-CoA synthetase